MCVFSFRFFESNCWCIDSQTERGMERKDGRTERREGWRPRLPPWRSSERCGGGLLEIAQRRGEEEGGINMRRVDEAGIQRRDG